RAGEVVAATRRLHVDDAPAGFVRGDAEVFHAPERKRLRADAAFIEAALAGAGVDDDLVAPQLHGRAVVDPHAQVAAAGLCVQVPVGRTAEAVHVLVVVAVFLRGRGE